MYDIVSKEYKADVSRSQPLTSKAEKVATPDQLVRANLRFVIKCALSQSGRGVPLDELVQAGNLGLVIASRRFNPSQGFRFITFAVHWVRRYIFMCIEKQSGIMAYPLQVQKDARRLYRLISKRESDGLPPPSDGEAASELGVTLGRIHNCRNYMARYASLDALQSRVNESDNNKYGEGLPLIGAFVSDADTPAEEMEDKEISEMLSRCLSELSPRSAEMIRKRYGLDGAEAQSYLQIAEAESPPLSRERVRQVIRDGFTALKKKPRLARLAAEALTGEVAHA